MAIKTKKKKNSSLSKRAKISYKTKEQGGGGSRVINWKDTNSEIQFFQPSIGKNSINILPYEIKSKNHPLVKSGEMEVGDLDYLLDIWTHRNIGPSESSVICLKKTYGKACPICEEAAKLKKQGKEKESVALMPKRRVFYNIEDVRKKPGELQIFEVSHFLFEKELIDEARSDEDNDDDFIDFADPESGSIINFRCTKVKQGEFEFNEFKSFSFSDRDDSVDDDLLSSTISFDAYLNILNYEAIQAILYGADESEDEEIEDSDEDEETGKKSVKNPKNRKPKKEEESEDDEESESDEDNDEDEKPVKKTEKKNGKKSDEDDEEDEEPPKKSSVKGKCPNGYVFGKDADDHEECEDCETWAKCHGAKK